MSDIAEPVSYTHLTPEGRVTDELPLRGEIFEELKCCAVSNIPRKISNIVELMKLAALDVYKRQQQGRGNRPG